MNLKNILLLCSACLVWKASAQINHGGQEASNAPSKLISRELNVGSNLYYGKVDVNIPIDQIDIGALNYPINLFYTGGSGIPIEELPSAVGLGWKMSEGFVQRVIRGKPDEFRGFSTKIETGSINLGGQIITSSNLTQAPLSGEFNYFNNIGKLNTAAWNTLSNIQAVSANADEKFIFNATANGLSVRIFDSKPVVDLLPDEFYFSFGQYSGKFFFDHTGKWRVISNTDVTFDVEVEQGEDINMPRRTVSGQEPTNDTMRRIIKAITLTSSDGFRITFGSLPNDLFLEYSATSGVRDFVTGTTTPYSTAIPSRWSIRKIENLNTKDYLLFNYSLPDINFTMTHSAEGNIGDDDVDMNRGIIYQYEPFGMDGSFNPTSPVSKIAFRYYLLKEIVSSRGIKVVFDYSESTQLNSDMKFNVGSFVFMGEEFTSTYFNRNHFYKLNSIKVYQDTDLVREHRLEYKEAPRERMKLKTLYQTNGSQKINQYTFQYGDSLLPPYGFRSKDHFGYYNGRDFFGTEALPFGRKILNGTYYNSREPVLVKAQFEALKKIEYQTGGYIEFEYELNSYSKRIDRNLQVLSNNIDSLSGGLRIKKIKKFDGSSTSEKIYEYLGENGRSSGTKNYDIQYYQSFGIINNKQRYYFRADANSLSPFVDNLCTYSAVTEKEVGNGKKVYVFSALDNGYKDKAPELSNITLTSLARDDNSSKYAFKDQAFKRGKIIAQKIYAESDPKNPIHETEYKYSHDFVESSSNNVRNLYIFKFGDYLKYSAVENNIYSNPIRQQLVRQSDAVGKIENQVNYEYDTFNNKKKEISVGSNGKTREVQYSYPSDFSGESGYVGSILKTMADRGMKSLPVEVITKENGKVIDAKLTEYILRNGLVVAGKDYILKSTEGLSDFSPYKFNGSIFTKDQRYTLEQEYSNHDSYGNPLEVISRKQPKISFQYGFKGQYVVAKVVNAGSDEFFYQGFEENGSGKSILEAVGSGLYVGKYTVPFKKPNTKRYIIDYKYYKDGLMVYIQKTYENNMVLADGQFIDEVRVYPEDAAISTFTYSPKIGNTSMTDARGMTQYYDYDSFGRLSLIRDFKGNVLKRFCYNYAGQKIDCTKVPEIFKNDNKMGAFVKTGCPIGYRGELVTYDVPLGKYSSLVDKETANRMAQKEIELNGQGYANLNGQCFLIPYVALVRENVTTTVVDPENAEEQYIEEDRGDIVIYFYKDSGKKEYATATPTKIYYSLTTQPDMDIAPDYASGTMFEENGAVLLADVPLVRRHYYKDGSGNWKMHSIKSNVIQLMPSSDYNVIN